MPGKRTHSLDQLPPLKAVEAFVVIADAGSFTQAATRLRVSPSALSRRIKTLEEHLGERLFDRGKARARLTAAGEAYRDAAERALEILATGKTEAVQAETETVSVTSAQFFINSFLAFNLADFEQKHPDITLTIDTSPHLADLHAEDFDVAIRYGVGDWPGHAVETIFITAGGPACAPVLANGRALPKRLEALSNHTLLHFSQEPLAWARFFEAAGVKGVKGANNRYFDDADLLYASATQGLGFALIDLEVSRPLLDAGQLIQPIDIEVATGDGFHFVFPPGREAKPAVRRFCDWVMSLDTIGRLRGRQVRFGY